LALGALFVVLEGLPLQARDDAPKPPGRDAPPWQRLLQGDEARKANELQRRLERLQAEGKLQEALEAAEALEALRRREQGADHWQTVDARWQAEALRRVLRQGKEAETEFGRIIVLLREAEGLERRGRHRQAQPVREKLVVLYRQLLGEEHPDTARAYNNLAAILQAQGRYAEAEASHREALAIWGKTLGADHPDTAVAYNNLAANQQHQGRYAEAEAGYRKVLAIFRRAWGEDHLYTAIAYNNLAWTQKAQGRYAEAEAGYRKALAILRQVRGEDHPDTATVYNNLAMNQNAQGRHAEAEAGLRKALAIRRRARGEGHLDTAESYNNLAMSLDNQGKFAEAEADYHKALAIRRKVLGEDHPDTAIAYSNLAFNQEAQHRYAEAEAGYRKALAIFRQARGEEHLDTATAYNNLALNQDVQGRYAEAEAGFRKALPIFRQALGEDHPDTVNAYDNLAFSAYAQGRYAEAESLWLRAATGFTAARLRFAASGLGRSARTGEGSPLPHLAAVLARNGKLEDAWRRYEQGLGRGTWDDLSTRLRRPAADQARQAELTNRLDRLDQLIERAAAVKEPSPEQERQGKELLSQRLKAQDELDAFARRLEQTYGPAAGQVFDRAAIQASLPTDAALLGWLDLRGKPKAKDPSGEHWAVLLRHAGPPVWVRLRGRGPEDAWVEADDRLPEELRAALQAPRGDWQPLAKKLYQQRLEPLAKHLAAGDGLTAVRHLLILPSPALAGVPAEVFADGYTVSYALSGTLYAHLRKQPRPDTHGLLAVADPVFDRPKVERRPPRLPPGGVLLTAVTPGSNADRAHLKPGDVLLRYADGDLAGPDDLAKLIAAHAQAESVAVRVWRDGKTFEWQLRPGPLGVVVAKEPAPKALVERAKVDQWLAASRDDDKWGQLPGTRVEVESLRRLFAAGDRPEPLLLTDSQASEQRLSELARGGELGKYRYLHLATHGTVDHRFPLRSAIILSRDHLPNPQKQLDAGLPIYDGRLTAEKVLRQWQLHSELVTLSACQTALGKYEQGEGFVGFAQALLLAGSRSVCLSLWKVDDAATALLMDRFYRNLLGRREGLKGPLPKGAALYEAKAWLRGLSREEAVKQAAQLSNGVERSSRPMLPLLSPVPPPPATGKGDCPYAHPYYWAAFVLIGDSE
jgi:CHAT domain-containing protein/Flp pilus assembly protein TadD